MWESKFKDDCKVLAWLTKIMAVPFSEMRKPVTGAGLDGYKSVIFGSVTIQGPGVTQVKVW